VHGLRLGVIDCGYDLKVARMVGQLRKRHPEVGVELAVGTSGDHRRAVLDQQLDAALVDTLRHVEPRGRIGLIFGCNADKDAAGMIAELVRGRREGVIDRLVTTRAADQPRSRSPEELRVLAGPGFGDRVAAAPHLAASWDVLSAMGNAEPADLVVVAGSFYLAGEAKRQRERGGGGLGAAPGSGRRGGRGRAASV